MDRELETKYASAPRTNIAFNSVISAYSTEAYPMLPPISVQTGAMQTFNRQGNEISPLKLTFQMMVGINAVTRSCALKVELFVMCRKDTKYLPTVLTNTSQPRMFNTGGAAPLGVNGYNGNATDAMYRYNLNEFSILKHKTFFLIGNVGLPNGDVSSGNSPNLYPGAVKYIKFDIPCPKTLKYDELTSTAATFPNNFAPFLVMGYSKVDGTPADTTFQSIVASWNIGLTYKDA